MEGTVAAPEGDAEQGASAEAANVVRAAGLMRSANGNLRRLAEEPGDSPPTAFFCECRNPACFSIVWLSAAEFDTIVAEQEAWLLVEGHEPSAPFVRKEPSPPPPGATPAAALQVPRSIGRWSSAVRQRRASSA